MRGQFGDRGNVLHRQHRAVGQPPSSRAEHPRMSIVRNRMASVAPANEVERFQHAARMIPMSMRQHDTFNRSQLNTQPHRIAFERILLRSGVEQNRMAMRTASSGNEQGESVTGAAQTIARQLRHTAAFQIGELGFGVSRNCRKAVSRIIDQDMNLDLIYWRSIAHGRSAGSWIIPSNYRLASP